MSLNSVWTAICWRCSNSPFYTVWGLGFNGLNVLFQIYGSIFISSYILVKFSTAFPALMYSKCVGFPWEYCKICSLEHKITFFLCHGLIIFIFHDGIERRELGKKCIAWCYHIKYHMHHEDTAIYLELTLNLFICLNLLCKTWAPYVPTCQLLSEMI